MVTSEARRVADNLRGMILSGDLADGERLPSLTMLAQQYGVTVDIARQAINALRGERLVTTRRGSGAFVSRFALIVRSSPSRLSRDVWGSGATIQDADTGPRPRTVDVVVSEVAATGEVAAALGVKPGRKVLSRARRFVVDDRPVQLATSYLPLNIAKGTAVMYTDTGPGGVYARLAERGHAPVRFVERVAARAPRPDERAALDMSASAGLVFEIIRRAIDAADRCVEVSVMVLDVAAYELEYAFPA